MKLQSDESNMCCNQNDNNEDETGKDDDLADDNASVANLTWMLQELELEEEEFRKKKEAKRTERVGCSQMKISKTS